MIVIYFNQDNADDANLATTAAQKLRALGKKVLLSNTHMFNTLQLERAEHVVAINSPKVVEAYEERNAEIEAANVEAETAEDITAASKAARRFQGIPVTAITEDPRTILGEVAADPDSDVEGDELGGMTREMLAEYAQSMLGVTLPANMRKSDMIDAIRSGMKAQTPSGAAE